MKKIIDGKLYDTECDSNIFVSSVEAYWESPEIYGPPKKKVRILTLYKTESGNFFFELCSNESQDLPSKVEIYEMHPQGAMRWCVDNQDHLSEEVDFSIFDNAFPKA